VRSMPRRWGWDYLDRGVVDRAVGGGGFLPQVNIAVLLYCCMKLPP